MEENIILIIAMLNIFISCFLKSNPEISKNKKYLSKGLLTLGIVLIMYAMAENIYDVIYIVLIFCVFMGLAYIYDKNIKESHVKTFFSNFLIWIVMFLMVKKINTYLIGPIPHGIWMGVIGFQSIVRWIHNGNKSEKLGLICMVSNFLAIIGLVILFNYFSEPMKGISKQEVLVKKYLIEKEKYKESEIVKIKRLSSDKKESSVLVIIDVRAYVYYYKQGKIEKIEEL
jgi:hypothetical protein